MCPDAPVTKTRMGTSGKVDVTRCHQNNMLMTPSDIS
jgi:hypothetical protein